MHTETEYLKILAVEIAATTTPETSESPNKHLLAEANRTQKSIAIHLLAIDNFPRREAYYFTTLSKVVDICDILYQMNENISADVMVLLDLITEIKKLLPTEISPSLKLSKAFVRLQRKKLVSVINELQQILKSQDIDLNLIALVTVPYRRFINAKDNLHWRNFTWLKGFEEKLENIDWENSDCNSKNEAIMSLLINCDFNDDRFFIYCKKYISERTNKYGTKRRRLAEFAICEKLILQDTLDEFPSYNHRRPNISKKLIDWIKIETSALKANDILNDEEYKIEYLWDVETISLFHKCLMDYGITKKVNVELYAKQIATTVSSIGKEEFQWETVHKRFYSKDQKSLKRMFEPLSLILEGISHFLKK